MFVDVHGRGCVGEDVWVRRGGCDLAAHPYILFVCVGACVGEWVELCGFCVHRWKLCMCVYVYVYVCVHVYSYVYAYVYVYVYVCVCVCS